MKDLIGMVFGRLTVVQLWERGARRGPRWKCVCTCGNEKVVSGENLRAGKTKSCGCLNDEQRRNQHHALKHGACSHPLFPTWSQMMQRCNDDGHVAYKDYGKRGIKVCERWHDPWKFFADMGPRPTPHHKIERRDNDAGYEPRNCYWATAKQQARNRRSNRRLVLNGVSKLRVEWSEITGIKEATLKDRIDVQGWSVEKALTTPVRKR